MKIVILQLAPQLGQTQKNIRRAEDLLEAADTEGLDLLVLPELAFTGYNFPSLEAITPHLEPTVSGVSTQWARKIAQRFACAVCIGYPEAEADPSAPSSLSTSVPDSTRIVNTLPTPQRQPVHAELSIQSTTTLTSPTITESQTESSTLEKGAEAGSSFAVEDNPDAPPNHNSSVLVSRSAEILAHYRKSFLYYTDSTWCRPGPGFYAGRLSLPPLSTPAPPRAPHDAAVSGTDAYSDGGNEAAIEAKRQGTLKVAMGICMDLNPERFLSAWGEREFARHVVASRAELVVLNMAWLSHDLCPDDVSALNPVSAQPHLPTLGYWLERLRPVVEQREREVVVVIANRAGVEGAAVYAGTSTVMLVGRGGVKLWGFLGMGTEGCLVVDTCEDPKFVLSSRGDGQGDREAKA